MAEALFEDFLTCPVCLETFKEPVSLGCNHSFCSECLKNHWQRSDYRTCPVCRRKSSKETVVVNFALKELTISFSERQKAKARGAEKEVECSKHPEEIRLFCMDDLRTLCPVCEFSLHTRHTVVSVEEALPGLKEQLRSQLRSLRDKRERVGTAEKTYTGLEQHSERQAEQCERQIRAEFQRLQQFLKEEEEARLEELREEWQRQAQTLGPELAGVREQLSALSQSIQAVEAVEAKVHKNNLEFLKEYRQTQSQARELESEPEPQLQSGLLINQAKILGNLGFRVWEKMRDIVQYSPVVLDPNSMNSSLSLSEDLTRVKYSEPPPEQLPDNPERFTNDDIVLGSEGFSSGTHSWDVEVGDYPRWDVGVVKESVDRRGEIFSDPEYGIWCLWHGEGIYNNGDSDHAVTVKRPPEKIRVRLDCNNGLLSFYDADDGTHLCTHKHKFTEKLFPYIAIGPTTGARTKEVHICYKALTTRQ